MKEKWSEFKCWQVKDRIRKEKRYLNGRRRVAGRRGRLDAEGFSWNVKRFLLSGDQFLHYSLLLPLPLSLAFCRELLVSPSPTGLYTATSTLGGRSTKYHQQRRKMLQGPTKAEQKHRWLSLVWDKTLSGRELKHLKTGLTGSRK